MFAGGSNALLYLSQGDLFLPYAACFGVISSTVTILSMFVLKELIKRYNRSSAIVFVLAVVICAAGLVIPVDLTLQTIKQAKLGISWYAFGSLCN